MGCVVDDSLDNLVIEKVHEAKIKKGDVLLLKDHSFITIDSKGDVGVSYFDKDGFYQGIPYNEIEGRVVQ